MTELDGYDATYDRRRTQPGFALSSYFVLVSCPLFRRHCFGHLDLGRNLPCPYLDLTRYPETSMMAERVCGGNWVAIGAAEVGVAAGAGFGRRMMGRSSGRL